MSISFVDLVESVLLLEAESNYTDVAAALDDSNSWISAINTKTQYQDFATIWLRAAPRALERNFAKKDIDEDLIALQDLIRYLAFLDEIKQPRNPIPEQAVLLNKVQDKYLDKNSKTYKVIDRWCKLSSLDPDEGYTFISTDIKRQWDSYKKGLDLIASNAFDQVKSLCLIPAIVKVINYKISGKQGLLGNVNPGGVGTFQGLIEDTFKRVNEYVINQADGVKWISAEGFKKVFNYILGTATVSQFEKKINTTSYKDIVRLVISTQALYDVVILSELSNYNITNVNVYKINDKNALLQFGKTGSIKNIPVTVIDPVAKKPNDITITSQNTNTLQFIERLNNDQSKAVIEQFKSICRFDEGGDDKTEQLSNMLGGLNQAAGVKL